MIAWRGTTNRIGLSKNTNMINFDTNIRARSVGPTILMYHALGSRRDAVTTELGVFERTIEALVEHGNRCVDLSEWVAAGRPCIERRFAITFDDGYRSIALAANVLSRYRLGATVFLATDFMGRESNRSDRPPWMRDEPILDWSETRDLAAAGFRFQPHSKTHPNLTQCKNEQIFEELIESKSAIEDRLGGSCDLFAYPFGASNAFVRRAVSERFIAAFGVRQALAGPGDDRFDLPRVDAYYINTDRAIDRLARGAIEPTLAFRRPPRAVKAHAKAWIESIRRRSNELLRSAGLNAHS